MAFFFKSKKNQPGSTAPAPTSNNREGTPSAASLTLVPSSANSSLNEKDTSLISQEPRPSPPQQQLQNQQHQHSAAAQHQDRSPPQVQSQYQARDHRDISTGRGLTSNEQQQQQQMVNSNNVNLYPWSQKKLGVQSREPNPFPRYGHAANGAANKEGEIYVMGGLIRSQNVRGDLWLVDGNGQNLSAYPVVTTSEGPGPRVGHASLLVGNAFIVFGGDTKMDERDALDETLYLLNTSSKQWSRAQPTGLQPAGRYGHTLNIVGSKLYVFGGQAEGAFFNDLMSFDLNTLQHNNSHWEMLVDNTDGGMEVPAKRTNHTVVSWGEKLFLFGGTNGMIWFNDVWSFDPRARAWSQLDCIGYIPSPREGHSAALVGDTMYIFGGRSNEGLDLGDLAAFRIPSRRWYTFQNMGPSPSPRSGHSMTTYGTKVIVLGGEPSVPSRAPEELTYVYILETSKIRYPNDQQLPERDRVKENGVGSMRRPSTAERGSTMGGVTSPNMDPRPGQLRKMNSAGPGRESIMAGAGAGQMGNSPLLGNNTSGSSITSSNAGVVPVTGSRLPRASIAQAPVGPPPQQQAPPPRGQPAGQMANGRVKTPTRPDRPQIETQRAPSGKENATMSPSNSAGSITNGRRTPVEKQQLAQQQQTELAQQQQLTQQQNQGAMAQQQSRSMTPSSNATPISPIRERTGSRQQMAQSSLEKMGSPTLSSKPLVNGRSPQADNNQFVSRALGNETATATDSSPVQSSKELETLRHMNAWYASELALARRGGYTIQNNNPPALLDDRAAESLGENDRPLLEALLAVKAELDKVQGSVETQANLAANRIAEVEKQRDVAVSEAVYAKAKLHAISGGTSANGSMSPVEMHNLEHDRATDMGRKLANALESHAELKTRLATMSAEIEAERRARQLADETAVAAQDRVSELDDFRNRTASEIESLRAELLDAEKTLRDEASNRSDAVSEAKLLRLDKEELMARLEDALVDNRGYMSSLEALKAAVISSQEKGTLLERQLEEDRTIKENLERKLARLKSEFEERSADLESTTKRLKDVEELADRHADEAKKAREAMVAGLQRVGDREVLDIVGSAADERVLILQEQVNAAKAMLSKSKAQADETGERLANAMQRVAGLELMQAQGSKEAIAMQRRMAESLEELRRLKTENTELSSNLARKGLDADAATSKHNALREILTERGVNTEARFASPAPGSGTPEQMMRMRDLESQLEASIKAHNETKTTADANAAEAEKAFSARLEELENNYTSVARYVKGTEKMLVRMKEELAKYKTQNSQLSAELEDAKSRGVDSGKMVEERQQMLNEMRSQSAKIQNLQAQLEHDQTQLRTVSQDLTTMRSQISRLESENTMLETRAVDAEHKVSSLLDQLGSSVESFRHDEHLSAATANDPNNRTSIALDSLATELDQLRSHWENTNKSYRLSSAFDFEKTPTSTEGGELSNSLAQWRQRLDMEEAEAKNRSQSGSRQSDNTIGENEGGRI